MISAVGRRYAKALVDVITTPGYQLDPNKALQELRAAGALISASQPLHNALLSPAVSPSRKRAVMGRLMDPMGMSKAVRNFLFVVIDHRRVHEFASIIEAFDRLLDERLGLMRGDVSSAFALTDAQRTELEAQLSRLSGKKAKLDYKVDPELIGGVVARMGAKVYDGSVRGQLEKLRGQLGKD
jgi:F-type H+-transporting ATPase subunit delta